ncbi:MAG: SsrA-binding protein SmpB [Amphiplicatus sp.]
MVPGPPFGDHALVAAKKADDGRRIIAENRRARRDYQIEDVIEAGLVLTGTEVKALREGRATIAEAYASPEAGGIYLLNANIPEYSAGNRENHQPKRPRKLLLHAREIARLSQAVERKGYTLAPLRLYFNARGIAKLEIGLALGRKLHDKRVVEKERDWARQKQRLMRERG